MRADGRLPHRSQDRTLWQRSRDTEAAEDMAERLLDLAGFADERLDPEDRARVAELLAREPEAAADVAAARALATSAPPPVPPRVFERAAALNLADAPQPAQVIPFPLPPWTGSGLRNVAQWGSLAAAIVMAAWLGFALGADTSMSLTRIGVQREDGFLPELLDPSPGFLRGLTEGAQT